MYTLYSCVEYMVPVSYTHLDVYKRQDRDDDDDGDGEGGVVMMVMMVVM